MYQLVRSSAYEPARRGPRGEVTAPTRTDEKWLEKYNYEHFWLKHFLADMGRTIKGAGVRPGSRAPEFEMPSSDGRSVSLSALRGQPVLLHFGSGT